jgi:hypothetical protein
MLNINSTYVQNEFHAWNNKLYKYNIYSNYSQILWKKIVNTYSHKIKSLNVGPWTLIEWKLHGNFKDFASQSH